MAATGRIEIGMDIPPVNRLVTQEKINLFESVGIRDQPNIHTDPEQAARRLGTTYPIASGRMSVTFASEALRRFFGPDVFHSTGSVNLKYLRPVKDGDTISVSGQVREINEEMGGRRVTVDLWCDNQHGDRTAVGTGSALVPAG
jgi:3-hydroxybutyryl-CoA dehydratase